MMVVAVEAAMGQCVRACMHTHRSPRRQDPAAGRLAAARAGGGVYLVQSSCPTSPFRMILGLCEASESSLGDVVGFSAFGCAAPAAGRFQHSLW